MKLNFTGYAVLIYLWCLPSVLCISYGVSNECNRTSVQNVYHTEVEPRLSSVVKDVSRVAGAVAEQVKTGVIHLIENGFDNPLNDFKPSELFDEIKNGIEAVSSDVYTEVGEKWEHLMQHLIEIEEMTYSLLPIEYRSQDANQIISHLQEAIQEVLETQKEAEETLLNLLYNVGEVTQGIIHNTIHVIKDKIDINNTKVENNSDENVNEAKLTEESETAEIEAEVSNEAEIATKSDKAEIKTNDDIAEIDDEAEVTDEAEVSGMTNEVKIKAEDEIAEIDDEAEVTDEAEVSGMTDEVKIKAEDEITDVEAEITNEAEVATGRIQSEVLQRVYGSLAETCPNFLGELLMKYLGKSEEEINTSGKMRRDVMKQLKVIAEEISHSFDVLPTTLNYLKEILSSVTHSSEERLKESPIPKSDVMSVMYENDDYLSEVALQMIFAKVRHQHGETEESNKDI